MYPHRLVLTWRMVMDDAMTAEGFTRLTYELDEIQPSLTSDLKTQLETGKSFQG